MVSRCSSTGSPVVRAGTDITQRRQGGRVGSLGGPWWWLYLWRWVVVLVAGEAVGSLLRRIPTTCCSKIPGVRKRSSLLIATLGLPWWPVPPLHPHLPHAPGRVLLLLQRRLPSPGHDQRGPPRWHPLPWPSPLSLFRSRYFFAIVRQAAGPQVRRCSGQPGHHRPTHRPEPPCFKNTSNDRHFRLSCGCWVACFSPELYWGSLSFIMMRRGPAHHHASPLGLVVVGIPPCDGGEV